MPWVIRRDNSPSLPPYQASWTSRRECARCKAQRALKPLTATTPFTKGEENNTTPSQQPRTTISAMRPLSYFLGSPVSPLLLVAIHLGRTQADTRGLPTAIRKMSSDAGEKLLQEYLAFVEHDQVASVGTAGMEGEVLAVNSSASIPYCAPFAPHFGRELEARDDTGGGGTGEEFLSQRAGDVVARLGRRDYACPTGSSDCSSIGYPNSCCQTGLRCVQITDTGLGPVGCCPDGISCSGSIACSGSQEGCPSDIGGGCCIEGFVCASIGCEWRNA